MVQMENGLIAVEGIQGQILSVLSDGNWQSLSAIASKADVSKSSASRHLYFMLSRGKIQWKPDKSRSLGAYAYRLIDKSLNISIKPYPRNPLDEEIDQALRQAVGNHYYYAGLAARYIYQLYDRFSNLNLVEVKVPKKFAAGAAESLNDAVSEWYLVVPDKMPWRQIQEAMQFGTVLRLIPRYVPREKGLYAGRNVEKIEYVLGRIRNQVSNSEYEALRSRAEEQGLLASQVQ
jgi:hypothetical protein